MVKIDQDSLVKIWKTYINDSSLFTKQRFGEYAHNKVVERGYAWPTLFYASSSKAYDLLWGYIHKGQAEGIRKLQ